jgi:exodeoxyribonuclease VII small subunit
MADVDELSFEQALEELTAIVERLESGVLSLEDSVNLYARGQRLSTRCQEMLDEATLTVRELDEDMTI